jgi:hypothetical protein
MVITPQEYIKFISDLNLGVIERLVIKEKQNIIVIRLSSCPPTLLPHLGKKLIAYYDKEGTVIDVPFTVTPRTNNIRLNASFNKKNVEEVAKISKNAYQPNFGGSRKRTY